MKSVGYLLIALLFSATFGVSTAPAVQEITESYSFENDMEGWTINGTDLNLGSGSIDWSITRTQENAKEGNTSLRFLLNNLNDKGKIWIEKPFAVEPNQIYRVRVEYDLAAFNPIDGGPLFTIITGTLNKSPKTREDLSPAFKDEAHNGGLKDGYQWTDKEYEFVLRSAEQGTLYVVLGIWGTWEVGKIFYFDNVRVTITKKPETSQFYSFEDDLQEWTAKNADLDSGSGTIERIKQFALNGEDGNYSIKFDLDSLNGNGKVWIERPFLVERGRKYKVALDYAFHSNDCGDTRDSESSLVFSDGLQKQAKTSWMQFKRKRPALIARGGGYKSYDFTIKAKKTDALYVVIGIWGTEKAQRTYNVDSVCVTITPK